MVMFTEYLSMVRLFVSKQNNQLQNQEFKSTKIKELGSRKVGFGRSSQEFPAVYNYSFLVLIMV